MKACCPRNHGCNARRRDEACALDVLRTLDDPDATRALALWGALAHGEQLGSGRRRRFLARAYCRARDRALARAPLAPRHGPPAPDIPRAA
jgi:hypothetical protein